MSAGAEAHRATTGGVGASRKVAGGADPPRAGANAALLARVEALHEVPGLEEEEAAAAAMAAAGAERAVVVAVAVEEIGAVKVVAGVFSTAEEEAVGVDAEHACIRSHLSASASASASAAALVLGSAAEVGAAGAEVAAIGSSSDDDISM